MTENSCILEVGYPTSKTKTVFCPHPTFKTQLFSVLILPPRHNCSLSLSYLQDKTALCRLGGRIRTEQFCLGGRMTENSCILEVG
jgi:hypothetical protein